MPTHNPISIVPPEPARIFALEIIPGNGFANAGIAEQESSGGEVGSSKGLS